MKIEEEKGGMIYVSDMPEWGDYSELLHRAKDAWKFIDTDYQAFNELWSQVIMDTQHLLANCIARGVRLAKENRY